VAVEGQGDRAVEATGVGRGLGGRGTIERGPRRFRRGSLGAWPGERQRRHEDARHTEAQNATTQPGSQWTHLGPPFPQTRSPDGGEKERPDTERREVVRLRRPKSLARAASGPGKKGLAELRARLYTEPYGSVYGATRHGLFRAL